LIAAALATSRSRRIWFMKDRVPCLTRSARSPTGLFLARFLEIPSSNPWVSKYPTFFYSFPELTGVPRPSASSGGHLSFSASSTQTQRPRPRKSMSRLGEPRFQKFQL
jgi:hypothetical protein